MRADETDGAKAPAAPCRGARTGTPRVVAGFLLLLAALLLASFVATLARAAMS